MTCSSHARRAGTKDPTRVWLEELGEMHENNAVVRARYQEAQAEVPSSEAAQAELNAQHSRPASDDQTMAEKHPLDPDFTTQGVHGISFDVPPIPEWTDVRGFVDHRRLLAFVTYDTYEEGQRLGYRPIFSLRARKVVQFGIWWGRQQDSDGWIWHPLSPQDGSEWQLGDPEIARTPELLQVYHAACVTAAERVLSDPDPSFNKTTGYSDGIPLVPFMERSAWAQSVLNGTIPPPLTPNDTPEIALYLR